MILYIKIFLAKLYLVLWGWVCLLLMVRLPDFLRFYYPFLDYIRVVIPPANRLYFYCAKNCSALEMNAVNALLYLIGIYLVSWVLLRIVKFATGDVINFLDRLEKKSNERRKRYR